MSIQKEDLLRLAGELSVGATETHWRSAVSRAYYAAYHGCHAWHHELPMPGHHSGHGGGVHQELINRMRNPDAGVPSEKRTLSKVLAAKLEVLRGQRGKADYELRETVDPVMTEQACELASEILRKL